MAGARRTAAPTPNCVPGHRRRSGFPRRRQRGVPDVAHDGVRDGGHLAPVDDRPIERHDVEQQHERGARRDRATPRHTWPAPTTRPRTRGRGRWPIPPPQDTRVVANGSQPPQSAARQSPTRQARNTAAVVPDRGMRMSSPVERGHAWPATRRRPPSARATRRSPARSCHRRRHAWCAGRAGRQSPRALVR